MTTTQTALDLAEVTQGYITALLWTNSEPGEFGDDTALTELGFDESCLSPSARETIDDHVREFVEAARPLLTEANFTGRADGTLASRVGHDLYMTAAGTGAGFWDGDWGSVGDELTKLAGRVGDVCVGDDDLIHIN